MKLFILAKRYYKTDYFLWKELKEEKEVLKAFNKELEVDLHKTGGMKYKYCLEINQSISFDQDLVDYINENYDEVEIKLISYVTADLSSGKQLKEAIEREKNAVTFFEKQLNKLEIPKISTIGKAQ